MEETDSKCKCFFEACYNGSLDVVKRLIADGVDCKSIDENGNTCVHKAVEGNKAEVLRFLIEECGADVNVVNNEKRSGLHIAIDNLYSECIEILLKNNCDITSWYETGVTPLVYLMNKMMACESHLKSRIEAIIGMLINSYQISLTELNSSGYNNFHIAVLLGNEFAVKEMLKKDADLLHYPDLDGNHALHLAARKRHNEIIETIINSGDVDIDLIGDCKRTALHVAILHSHISTIELLVNKGANCNAIDENGDTPLHKVFQQFLFCCCKANKNDILCIFHEKIGEKTAIREIYKYQPQLVMKKCVFLSVAEFLIREGNADISIKNNDSETPLDIGQFQESIEFYFKQLHCFPDIKKLRADILNEAKDEIQILRNAMDEKNELIKQNSDALAKLKEISDEKSRELDVLQNKVKQIQEQIRQFKL